MCFQKKMYCKETGNLILYSLWQINNRSLRLVISNPVAGIHRQKICFTMPIIKMITLSNEVNTSYQHKWCMV